MTLALSAQFPILDVFWTMLVVFGLALLLWTVVVVFRDLFGRTDVAWWGKTLWVLAVLILPIAGSLAYLVSQSAAMGERQLRREGAADLSMDAHLHAVSGGGYRGVRDVTRSTQAWSGPIRPS